MIRTACYRLSTLACAIAAGLGVSATAIAQESDDDESLNTILEEVIVTASRREESLQDVAAAVAVVDTGKYADAGLVGLADVLPFVPGVSVIDSGRPYFNLVYMRGINAVLSAGVTSYLDEIPVGSSTVYTTPAPLDGTLLDLGTMDVLKGPQGTLYGASAIGGILKFNTRAPSLENWSGSASANLSDTHGGGFNQLYRANLNGPIIGDTLGISFTAFSQEDDGYIDNVALGKENWDSYEYYGGSGSLLWQATENLSFTFQAMVQNATQDGATTVQANHAQDQLQPGLAAGEPWYGEYETGAADLNPSEYEAELLGLTIRYSTGFGEFLSVTSSQEVNFTQETDLTVPYAAYADLFYPDNAPHTKALFIGDLGFEKVTQEFRLVSESNETFEWIVGAFYTEEEGHNIQRLDTTPASDLLFVDFPSTYQEKSAFATGTWYFTPDFDASVGLRYTDYSNDVELAAVGPLIAPLPYIEIEDDVTNYLANLRWRPSDNMSIYARVASGFRPGGANFLLLDADGNPLTDPFFRPDELVSYELGLKGTTADGRFSYDLAAFHIDWEDYQVRTSVGGVSVAANAGKASSDGVEAALGFALTDNLILTGSLTWTDARMGEDEPVIGSPKGERLPLTPEWQAALDAQYNFQLGNLPAYVGAAWRYKGEMFVGMSGYTDAFGTFYPGQSPRITLPSYDLVDLRGGVTVGAFDFSLYVTNVFDEWAWTSFDSLAAGISTGTPTRPRTVGGVVRWNF
ncbi:TonB-dependent receptor [Marinihelvus fidelis]|uniref:TonB-dependent receptor n=1 Tax=Marinihelvus fidelis TaxID=2613842 RepID=A0A5N0TJF4_9GAMM|nr:TonB-dependent receptor [Marinihelvus fidelis]KAA9134026.1 TonB-dependent receptor [Marinihelvus fidelis]